MSGCHRTLVVTVVAVGFFVAPVGAQVPGKQFVPHVRSEVQEGGALVEELVRRSPTGREIVAELDRSTVIVYIRYRLFKESTLVGRIGLLSSVGDRRYLIVELAWGLLRVQALQALAHELYHATEIARAPEVVDTATLSGYYSRIGDRGRATGGGQMFETWAAVETTSRVHRELVAPIAPGDRIIPLRAEP
jgi:hypothetical protein